MHYAAAEGHTEVVTYLCDNMAVSDINTMNHHGETALFRAAVRNHPHCLRALKEAGADHRISHDGLLASHAAAQQGCTAALAYLVSIDPSLVFTRNDEGAQAW